MPVDVTCGCGQRLEVSEEFIGRLVRCPGCNLPLEVVRPSEAGSIPWQPTLEIPPSASLQLPNLSVQPPAPIEILCTCGRLFLAGAHLAGKMVRCPDCKIPVEVPEEIPEIDSIELIEENEEIRENGFPDMTVGEAKQPVAVLCGCGRSFLAGPHLIGKAVRCPECNLPVEVPGPDVIHEVDHIEILDDDEDAGGIYALNPEDAKLEGVRGTVMAAPTAFRGMMGEMELDSVAECLAYSAGGIWGLAGQGEYIQVIDMKDFTRKFRFKGHEDKVTCMATAADAGHALSGDDRGRLIYWHIAKNCSVKRFKGHQGAVNAVAFSPGGKYAATGGEDGAIRLWELPEAREFALADARWEGAVLALAYSPDGKYILAGGEGGRVALWSVTTCKRIHKFKRAHGDIETVAFAQAGTVAVAAALRRGSIGLEAWQWEIAQGRSLPTFTNPSKRISEPHFVELSPNGLRLVVGARKDLSQSDYQVKDIPGQGALLTAMGVGITVHGGHNLELWTLEAGHRAFAFEEVFGKIVCLAVNPENTRILGSLKTGLLVTWALPM